MKEEAKDFLYTAIEKQIPDFRSRVVSEKVCQRYQAPFHSAVQGCNMNILLLKKACSMRINECRVQRAMLFCSKQ
eukprot:6433974-Amphidinium_carterae.1